MDSIARPATASFLHVSGHVTVHLARIVERATEIANTKGYRYLGVEHMALAMAEDEHWYGVDEWDRPLTSAQWRQELIDGLPPPPAAHHRPEVPLTIDYRAPELPTSPPPPCPFVQEFEFLIFATTPELDELGTLFEEFLRRRAAAVDDLFWQVIRAESPRPLRRLERRWRAANPGEDPGERSNRSVFVGLYLLDSEERDRLLNELCAAVPDAYRPWAAGATAPESPEQAREYDLGAKYPDLAHLESR